VLTKFCITDIATAPIDGCADWLEEPSAPSNWKDPAKIAAYVAEKKLELTERAGLDPDLGRITGIAVWRTDLRGPAIHLCRTEREEADLLEQAAAEQWPLLGFNSLKFDWPFMLRRAAYLGVPMSLNLDRYRTPHVDVSEILTHRGLLTPKSLGFYVRRHQWTDLCKPLSGAEEAMVPQTGRWDDLRASLVHDVTATYRLACWLGLIQPVAVPTEEPVF